jgi:4-amino-4-deoxy-L-arabinose transferase-like glycosyltransferase
VRQVKYWYGFLAVLAGLTYFYGLDSPHIPKNGDEYPYLHITRLTAAADHLLPLQSELPGMRNTKPPLLFWQGIASTGGGHDWTLWNLRYPSVVLTLLTALEVYLLAARMSGQPETGALAAVSFLAFFSTYRYGRPFLTNAPEVFWLFTPFFALLRWRPASFRSRLLFPISMGMAVGMALLYKSFALAVPVGVGLVLWYWTAGSRRLRSFLANDSWKIAITLCIALALFGSWFVLDPDPRSVWQEFVVGENAGKFAMPGGYLPRLLWGTSSLWAFALGYPLNAGLLAFPVAGLFFVAWRRRDSWQEGERLLWLFVLTLFVTFSFPSQRSSRYLLPAMPALAVLLALRWHQVSRRLFIVSLLATGAVVAAITYLSVRLEHATPGAPLYSLRYWVLLTVTGSLVVGGLFMPKFTGAVVHAGIFLCYLSFTAFLAPIDGALGRYDPQVQQAMRGRTVFVPVDFVAKEEGYRFLLPEATLCGYREDPAQNPEDFLANHPLAAVQVPLESMHCGGCSVLGQRLELRGRQTPREIGEILKGRIFEHLIVRELLIEAPAPNAAPSSP